MLLFFFTPLFLLYFFIREGTRGSMREPVRRFTSDYSAEERTGFFALLEKARVGKELASRRLQACKSFVPRRVARRLVSVMAGENPAVAETMTGAVLFADVSGFTALSEKLKKDWEALLQRGTAPGWSPSERLCQKLNDYWRVVIDNTHEYGGDVIKFSGDAITVLFVCDKQLAVETGGYICPDLASATLRAAQCSEAIHEKTQKFAPELTLHMGIGAGAFTGVNVGGAFGRMEYILAGDPMKQVAIAEPIAVSGETGISPHAFELLPSGTTGKLVTELPEEYYDRMPIKTTEGAGTASYQRNKRKTEHRDASRTGYRLLGRKQWTDSPVLPPIPKELPSDATVDQWTHELKHYIPAAVTDDKLTLEESDHLAENLTVSVIFVSIDGIELSAESPETAHEIGTLAQRLMLRIQETIYQWEGSVNKLMVDDKGLLVLCALGLPPMRHGDDPYRAVCAAMDIPAAIKRVHPDAVVRVGVSTGQAFCGIVGHSELRREYTVMGSCVNLCARLMTSAEPGTVLVSEATAKSASAIDYAEPKELNLKGIGHRRCYKPVPKPADLKREKKEKKVKKKDYDKMLLKLNCGRDDEVGNLHSMLGRARIDRGGLILITGERGQGKTFMLDQAWAIADEPWAKMIRFKAEATKGSKAIMAYKTFKIYEDLFEKNGEKYESAYDTSVYPAWRGVIAEMVVDGASRSGVTVQEWVNSALIAFEDGSLQRHTDLLLDFLPLEAQRTGGSDEAARNVMLRYDATLEVIGDLLHTMMWRFGTLFGSTLVKIHLQKNSSVISAFSEMESWSLLKRVTDARCNIVVVVGTRSFSPSDFSDPVVKQILDDCQALNSVLDLKNFGEAHSRKFAANLLSSRDVQNYPYIGREAERGLPPTETYTISMDDLPEELKTMLYDVAQGNPKNILEVIDPLLSGYSKPTDYISQSTLMNSDDWSNPVIEIKANHQVQILENPATMKPYDLDQFPWPAKVVQYVEQTFQELQDHKQYILRVASIFEYGFTSELMRPFIETFQEGDLRELVGHGFLMKLGPEWFSEGQWEAIEQMDPTVTTVFCFSSTLLKRLISTRIVQRELEHLKMVRAKAIVRCRWIRLAKGWSDIKAARNLLELHGFNVKLHTLHRKDSALVNEARAELAVRRRNSIIRKVSETSIPETAAPVTKAETQVNQAPSAAFMITYMLVGAILAVLAMRFTTVNDFIESLGRSAGLW